MDAEVDYSRSQFMTHIGQKVGLQLNSSSLVIDIDSYREPLQDFVLLCWRHNR
jgi:hypothetical protein